MPKYEVGIWWYELHGDTIEVEAENEEKAKEKARETVEHLGDHGYNFSDTYSDKGKCGVDEAREK